MTSGGNPNANQESSCFYAETRGEAANRFRREMTSEMGMDRDHKSSLALFKSACFISPRKPIEYARGLERRPTWGKTLTLGWHFKVKGRLLQLTLPRGALPGKHEEYEGPIRKYGSYKLRSASAVDSATRVAAFEILTQRPGESRRQKDRLLPLLFLR